MIKIVLMALCLSLFGATAASTVPEFVALEKRWSEGPWRGVSQMVLFDQRLWFVNSNPFKDTNAADLYTLSLRGGNVRYEQSLFSQDVGNPAVFDGQLYLPFEDPRRSAGRGEYIRTDGSRFEWKSFSDGRAFHVHAMGVCQGRLMAVTGAFSGQLQINNGGWQLLDEYPEGTAGFSRLVSIMPFGSECLFGAMARGDSRPKLLRLDGDSLSPVAGWPSGDRVETTVVFADQALAFNDKAEKRLLLAWDRKQTTEILLPDGRARALAVDGEKIYLITSDQTGGALWFADESFEWQLLQRFDTTPVSLLTSQGVVFVGTWSTQGGALYSNFTESELSTPSAVALAAEKQLAIDTDSLTRRVDAWWKILSKPPAPDAGLDQLRQLIKELELDEHPRVLQKLSEKIDSLPATGVQKMFGSRELDRSAVIRWYIKTTAALRGVAQPALNQLALPFTKAENPAAKYFDDTVAAILGVGRNRGVVQSLQKTARAKMIEQLIERLQRQDDPLWVQGDIVAALTRLTNQSYAYNRDGWARWFEQQ